MLELFDLAAHPLSLFREMTWCYLWKIQPEANVKLGNDHLNSCSSFSHTLSKDVQVMLPIVTSQIKDLFHFLLMSAVKISQLVMQARRVWGLCSRKRTSVEFILITGRIWWCMGPECNLAGQTVTATVGSMLKCCLEPNQDVYLNHRTKTGLWWLSGF